jgi:hypothetical protein
MKHRRKNPMADSSLLTLGLIAGAGYLFITYVLPLLKGLGTATTTLSNAGNAVTTSIADAIVAATHTAPSLTGGVILSTGEQITTQDLANSGGLTAVPGSGSSAFTFSYNGNRYVISSPRDSNGNYLATLVTDTG